MTRNLPQRARNAARNGHTSGADADEREVVGAFVALDDLVRNPGQGTADSIRIHYDRHAELLSEVERVMRKGTPGMYTSSRTRWTAYKEAIELYRFRKQSIYW